MERNCGKAAALSTEYSVCISKVDNIGIIRFAGCQATTWEAYKEMKPVGMFLMKCALQHRGGDSGLVWVADVFIMDGPWYRVRHGAGLEAMDETNTCPRLQKYCNSSASDRHVWYSAVLSCATNARL